MNHQKYIDQAVQLAGDNVKQNGKPFGAVIVKNDDVISTGINKAIQTGDLTAHAETEAIRTAGLDGKSYLLEGATLYASGHPCPMCLSAAYLAGIKEIYYASTLEEAREAGLGGPQIYKELKKDWGEQKIALRQMPAKLEENPFKQWGNR
ncbi:MAG TPA: nucleoside deaminase [Balneolaceae bacterium]|nr:nucleoside deaminase [Balneolaceae bacterium]